MQAPLIDSILADIGVEGGSLAKMPGLIREARDMQGIREFVAQGTATASPPRRPPRVRRLRRARSPAERGPRKKGA